MEAHILSTTESLSSLIDSFNDRQHLFDISPNTKSYTLDKSFSDDIITWYNSTIEPNASISDTNKSYLIELSIKNLLYKRIASNTSSDKSHRLSTPACIMDLTFALRDAQKIDHTLPHIILEELLDIQPISWCEKFWPYLISRHSYIVPKNMSGSRAPGTTLIRLGNSLLRRLSKTQHARFSGEILMYLAAAFPLTEKSALNIRGAFNTDNVTYYQGDGRSNNDPIDSNNKNDNNNAVEPETDETKKDATKDSADQDVEMEDVDKPTSKQDETGVEQNKPPAEDEKRNEMYRKFWSLQDVFRDPTVLFDESSQDEKQQSTNNNNNINNTSSNNKRMEEFKTTLTIVFNELKKWEAKYNTKRDRENEIRRQEMDLSDIDDEEEDLDNEEDENDDDDEDDDEEEANDGKKGSVDPSTKKHRSKKHHDIPFVPKWLTRRDLFDLQLKDVSFRRAVLTQMAILIEFLLSLTPKSKTSKYWQEGSNKSVLYSYTLSEEDTSFFKDLRRSLRKFNFTSLDFQPPYVRTIDAVLTRDRYWQYWKMMTCPPFLLNPVNSQSVIIDSKELHSTNQMSEKDALTTDQIPIVKKAEEVLVRLQKPRPEFGLNMGTLQLSQVWEIPTGCDMLKKPQNYTIKHAEVYYQEIKELEEEFKNNYELEVEVTDDEEEEEEKEKEKKKREEEQQPNPKKRKNPDDEEEEKETEKEKEKDNEKTENNDTKTEEKKEQEEEEEQKQEKPKKMKMVVKNLASSEERREYNEKIGSKNWRGLRAARAQGYWSRFGKITRGNGIGGLFEESEEEEDNNSSSRHDSSDNKLEQEGNATATTTTTNDDNEKGSEEGIKSQDSNDTLEKEISKYESVQEDNDDKDDAIIVDEGEGDTKEQQQQSNDPITFSDEEMKNENENEKQEEEKSPSVISIDESPK